MDRVTLQNYRCFREKQSARLAPLTFLVGENSTGKTSFLALMRALWQVAFQDRIPDFRQPPYDLGSFEDVVHYRGANNKRPDSFEAGFKYADAGITYRATFENREGYPFPLSENPCKLSARRLELGGKSPPFASAPIRFRPKRTYDPSRPTPDPEGEYIPDYFASMSRNAPEDWERLKSDLEGFGRDSGLFDEIGVLSFGKTAGSPFQVQIRKFGKRLKGPKRNLIDVGYGVSQALPILTELLREDSPRMFLLQQPEVHLHPRAQAALGSLFCNLAASGKQIVVETHSDYMLDRARMDIRDGKTGLKAKDISILYFERGELDVNIHSLRVDKDGNVCDSPPGYGQFFMDEMRRSVGL